MAAGPAGQISRIFTRHVKYMATWSAAKRPIERRVDASMVVRRFEAVGLRELLEIETRTGRRSGIPRGAPP